MTIREHLKLTVWLTIICLVGFPFAFVQLTLPWKDAWWNWPGALACFIGGGVLPGLLMRRYVKVKCPRPRCDGPVRCLGAQPFEYKCEACRFHLVSKQSMGFSGVESGDAD